MIKPTHLYICIIMFLLVGNVNAAFSGWTSANGCWTATDGSVSYVMWNDTGAKTWVSPAEGVTVWYTVVAGGGGGAGGGTSTRYGAGGGAGGFLNASGLSISGTVNVVVGDGGAGGSASNVGTNGQNSSFANTTPTNGINARGGGGGGSYNSNNGVGGGSGGGSYRGGTVGSGVAPQGNNGGLGYSSSAYGSGGGGGGTATGSDGATANGGAGGAGNLSSINGTAVRYAGGGGGAGTTGGTAGTGGGGTGGSGTGAGTDGTTATGGGGGGSGTSQTGGKGGSGIVIIRYNTPPPVSGYSGTPTSGSQPLSVTFTDSSTNIPTSWKWTYKNATQDWTQFSTSQNPTYSFPAGTYDINLTATNGGGSDDEIKVGYIDVSTAVTPVASFTISKSFIRLPTTITLTDTSTNTPTSWDWGWGDGTANSTTQNPTHKYNKRGKFIINLIATNAAGSNAQMSTVRVIGYDQIYG